MYKKLISLYIIINSFKNIYLMRLKKVQIDFKKINIVKGFPLIKNRGTFIIENDIKINSKYSVNPIGGAMFSTFIIEKNAKLTISKGSRISNVAINCINNIYIGKNVFIGGDTRIYDSDFHSLRLEERMKKDDNDIKSAPIYINDGVFIGASAIILKGVIIGKNSIVGAGSVVAKNIPDNEIWAGNPAKFIKKVT